MRNVRRVSVSRSCVKSRSETRAEGRGGGALPLAQTTHLLEALFLWPVALSFPKGMVLLPLLALPFVSYLGLRIHTPAGWRLAVSAEGVLAVVLIGSVSSIGWMLRAPVRPRWMAEAGDLAVQLLLGLLLLLTLVSTATLLFLMRRETRSRYGVHLG